MFSKIHLVAKRSGVLGLGASVAQQRLENNLMGAGGRVKTGLSRQEHVNNIRLVNRATDTVVHKMIQPIIQIVVR